MKVTCEQCNKEFLIAIIQEHNHGKGIIETYFTCTHCDHRYTATYTNGVIRDRIKKYAKEWAKLSQLKKGKEWDRAAWMKKYEKLQAYKAVTDGMMAKLKESQAPG